MTKRRTVIYGIVASVVAVAFSASGFIWFSKSNDWIEIKNLVSLSPTVVNDIGKVDKVELSLYGFSYKYSGSWGRAELEVTAHGSKGMRAYSLVAERSQYKWNIISIIGS